MKDLLNKKILIVDDEPQILKMIEETLWNDGFFNIHKAENYKEAVEIAKSQPIALFLLDVNLPDGNGFMLYKAIREFSDAPVIFLTARGEAEDKVRGFKLGADDYIVKPFLMSELVLRVTALLRRTYAVQNKASGFYAGDRYIDFEKAAVISGGCETALTAKEFIIIKKLWENKNRIVTNDSLCMTAWGEDYYGHENTLMVHMRRLRKKIEPCPSEPQYLLTAKGLGYKLVIENE